MLDPEHSHTTPASSRGETYSQFCAGQFYPSCRSRLTPYWAGGEHDAAEIGKSCMLQSLCPYFQLCSRFDDGKATPAWCHPKVTLQSFLLRGAVSLQLQRISNSKELGFCTAIFMEKLRKSSRISGLQHSKSFKISTLDVTLHIKARTVTLPLLKDLDSTEIFNSLAQSRWGANLEMETFNLGEWHIANAS